MATLLPCLLRSCAFSRGMVAPPRYSWDYIRLRISCFMSSSVSWDERDSFHLIFFQPRTNPPRPLLFFLKDGKASRPRCPLYSQRLPSQIFLGILSAQLPMIFSASLSLRRRRIARKEASSQPPNKPLNLYRLLARITG